VRAVTGTPHMHDNSPAWSPDGATIAYASERSGFYELHLAGAEERRLTSAGADHLEFAWHLDGTRLVAVRGRRNRFDLVVVDAASGEAEVVAQGGTWGRPCWTPGSAIVGTYEDHATPPQLRLATATELHTPAPRATRRAPYAKLEEITFSSFDGLEIPAFLRRP
jgi:dipeptidyl aminopeptidase/acylaminoacyl peptidase